MKRHIKHSDVVEVTQNFEWEMTNKKICIFMPNHWDSKYVINSLKNIRTVASKDDYIIIIGLDNNEADFSGMEDDNVYYFSVKRKDGGIRNSGFIRNYCLKRCRSEKFFQKDGEVVILGDFIQRCIESEVPWRAGKIYVLNEEQTENYLETNDPSPFITNPTKIIEKTFPKTVNEVHQIIDKANGQQNLSTYFQYAFCERTSVMQGIGGYDEDYFYYGYEDSDMFCRLYSMGRRLIPDYNCSAIHQCHPRNLDLSAVKQMANIFSVKDMSEVNRNPGGWGEL